jgi:DNA invertase Pin-like site-specific DNA recombinase
VTGRRAANSLGECLDLTSCLVCQGVEQPSRPLYSTTSSRARLELARLMAEMRRGDVLNVVRLDRLARSVSHLLELSA